MATIYFTASSLDGFIVDENDSLDWLMSRAVDTNGPFGYEGFAKSVGALVMGSATYEWVVAHQPGDWLYEQPTWVLTHRPQIVVAGHPVQTFDGDVADLHPSWCRRPPARTCGWSVAGRPRRSSSRRVRRRNDRHLRAMLAGHRRAATAAAVGVEVGGVGGQRRLRLRALDRENRALECRESLIWRQSLPMRTR